MDIPGSLSKIYKHIRTHVTFDTPTSLLVAAADCLMSVDVTKNACTMAWEMDVVALGVCPLDSQNVQVCGLVKEAAEEGSSGRENMFGGVEMQVRNVRRTSDKQKLAEAALGERKASTPTKKRLPKSRTLTSSHTCPGPSNPPLPPPSSGH